MKLKTASLILTTLLVAACGRQQTNSDGNGPGKADGVGGREDPPTAPATDLGQPATGGEPASGAAAPPATQPQE
jgi:hypothetical protein